MKSVKQGRGPSFMTGIACVAVAVFGVIWTVSASSMGAPPAFALFGLVFIGLAIAGAVYSFHSATAKNRPSVLDIVDENEEPDPLNQRFGEKRFCTYCGAALPESARFCPGCGKELPSD